MYIVIFIISADLKSSSTSSSVKLILKRLLGYPFIVIFCWTTVCIRDTIGVNGYPVGSNLSMLGNSLACTQGLLTAIYFFLMSDDVIYAWTQLLWHRQTLFQIAKNAVNRRNSNLSASPNVNESPLRKSTRSSFQNDSNKVYSTIDPEVPDTDLPVYTTQLDTSSSTSIQLAELEIARTVAEKETPQVDWGGTHSQSG